MSMTTETILILKSLAVNYPILRSWGYIFPKPIALVVQPGTAMQIMEVLINFPENGGMIKNKKNSDFVFYSLDGRKGNGQEEINNILWADKGNQGFPMAIAENVIPEMEDTNYFFIYLEDDFLRENIKISEIVPFPQELEIVHRKILEMESAKSKELQILQAAVFLLEPGLYRQDAKYQTRRLLEVAETLCIMDEEMRDTQDLKEVFIDRLYQWQEENEFGEMYSLQEMDLGGELSKDMMFFDEYFVYMSDALFKKIVQPLLKYVPINSLKRKLAERGVIDSGSESAATYTVKVSVGKKSAGCERIRMMRFRKNELDRLGDVGWVDVCCMAKEEREE